MDREDVKNTIILTVFIIAIGLITAFLIIEMVLYYESKKCSAVPQIEEQKQMYINKVKEIVK